MIIALAAVGFVLSLWLTYLHVRLHRDPSYVAFCAFNPQFNCESVAASPFSIFLGVPVALWGIVVYLIVVFIGRGVAANIEGPGCGAGVLTLVGIVLGVISIVLFGISLFAIKALCVACLGTYLVNIGIALVSFKITRTKGGLRSCVRTDLGELSRPASR